MRATVSPSILVFRAPGQTKTIKVTLRNRAAPLAKAAFGSLVLRGAGNVARLPIAVTPQALDAPEIVRGTGASGSLTYQVKPGFTGQLPVTPRGLAAAQTERGDLRVTDPPAEYTTEVPANSKLARFRAVADNPEADIDLDVFRVVDGNPTLVASSATASGTEEILLTDPVPGTYLSVVYPYSNASGESSTAYEFQGVAVAQAVGNYTVTPANAAVRIDVPLTLTARWTGLTAGTDYVGWIGYPDGTGTIIEVS